MNSAVWTNTFPTHWRRVRLKNLVAGITAGVWGEEPAKGEGVACIRAADFDREHLRVSMTKVPLRKVAPEQFGACALAPGDLVLEKSGGGDHQPVGAVVLFDHDFPAVPTNFAARIRPHPTVDARFLNYVFAATYALRLNVRSIKQTTGLQNLDVGSFFAEEWAEPPQTHQVRIADFLDRATARIDALIERKQELVELLHGALSARVAAQIDQVARSSVTLRLRRVAVVCFSAVDKKTNEGDLAVRLCNYTDVYKADEIRDDPNFMEATATSDQIERLSLRAGDVLVTKDSETPDDIGVPAWVPEDLPGVVCGYHLAIIRPDQSRLRGDYLFWALRSPMCQSQFSVAANGITRFGLRAEAVQAIHLPVPPLSEQAAIAADLRRAASSAHRAADAVTRQVSLLREHRQALITAAVTGQIDVAGKAA